jgi:hypothetical protein
MENDKAPPLSPAEIDRLAGGYISIFGVGCRHGV